MEHEIGGFHVYDALVDVVGEARTVNFDFDLYEMQKQVKLFMAMRNWLVHFYARTCLL